MKNVVVIVEIGGEYIGKIVYGAGVVVYTDHIAEQTLVAYRIDGRDRVATGDVPVVEMIVRRVFCRGNRIYNGEVGTL
jgi:hypothetical protein